MKVSSDQIKAYAYIGLGVAGVYLVFKLYKASTGISDTVTSSLGGAWDAVASLGTKAATIVRDAGTQVSNFGVDGVDKSTPDQALAETARLHRNEDYLGYSDVNYNAPGMSAQSDALGNIYGGATLQ